MKYLIHLTEIGMIFIGCVIIAKEYGILTAVAVGLIAVATKGS
jgi:dolichyl-phosphate-mannose--protein O-mannosyl transferase